MSGKMIWTPMPASRLYGVDKADPESVRERMVRQYGEATVTSAELSTVLDIMMMVGMIKPSEFVEVIGRKLHRMDERRRRMANLDEDRG